MWTATVNYGDGTGIQPLALSGKSFNLSHVYKDNGIYTVTVTLRDQSGNTGTAELQVKVNNFAPIVYIDPVTVTVNKTLYGSGSFYDPGKDTWIASVDYGDGSGIQPLGLYGKSFTLNHRYANNGTYTVTVMVTDSDGGHGYNSVKIMINDLR